MEIQYDTMIMLTWQFQFDFIIVSSFRNGSTAGLEDHEKEVIAWCSLAKVSSVSAFRQGVTRAICSERERFGNLWRTWREKNIIFVDFVVKPMVLWRKGGCTLFSLLLKLPKLINLGVVWIVTFGFCWLLTIAFFMW